MPIETFLFWVAVAVVTVVSAARVTRLITQDTYPPAAAARSWWIRRTKGGEWSALATCPYCAAPYITLAILGWGALADFDTAWWFVNGALAAAYAAAKYVVTDGE